LVWSDAAQSDDAPPLPSRALIYTRTTGFRHDSIPAAIAALQRALPANGIVADATEDLSQITPNNLANYGAIVLVSTTGEPFGPGNSPEVEALVSFVRNGGALVGLHSVADAYGCNDYSTEIGGVFRWHPGNTRTANCYPEGSNPAVAQLPAMFSTTDEFHLFWNFRPDNQVILRCDSEDGTTRIPIAWVRPEGLGRLFVTTLGHPIESWSDAMFLDHHVIPGVLWAMRR
jgi:type 1 glutamine amidotransferase